MEKYLVQQRKDRGKWHTRWSFDSEGEAAFYYVSLNTFGEWRKRLLAPNGEVLASQYPTRK
jgi:hypothetical protein